MMHRLVITDLIGPDIVEESYDWVMLYKLARAHCARKFSIEPLEE